ncbi:MAG: DUF3891 family protein [Thermodesulfobacteriota bacterium]
MIRRDDAHGWILVTQYDHAVLAGNLMERWGNETFSSPRPRGEVLFAAREHDCGWKEWDSAPRINPENGYPANFMEMESSDQTDIWRRSFESHAEEHPYASALIALHFARFNRKLLSRDPSDRYAKTLESEIYRFVSGKLGIDASGPQNLTREVKVNLRLLQVGDIISLALCHGWESMEIPDVPVDYGGNSLSLVLKSHNGFDFTLSPYPFSEAPLGLRVEARKLAGKIYADDGDLRKSLASAPFTTLDFTIIKG